MADDAALKYGFERFKAPDRSRLYKEICNINTAQIVEAVAYYIL